MEGARPEWLELPPDGNNGWIPRRHNLQRNLQVGLEPSHQLAHGTFSLCCSLNSYSVRVHQAPFIALQSGPKELYAMGLPGVPLGVDAQGFFNSPDTGYYACAAQLKFEYATGGFFRIVISVNGQLDVNSGLQAVEGNKGSTNYFTLRVAGTTYMKTGDTISVSVFSDKDDSYRCEWCVCVCVCVLACHGVLSFGFVCAVLDSCGHIMPIIMSLLCSGFLLLTLMRVCVDCRQDLIGKRLQLPQIHIALHHVPRVQDCQQQQARRSSVQM